MSPKGLLTTAEVAEALRVSPRRVHQLVAEGKLPAPTELTPRMGVWRAVDIQRIAASQQDRSTGLASILAPAPRPLRRVHDTFLDVQQRYAEAWPIHVRVWQGEAPEGWRTVVVCGALTDSIDMLQNWAEAIAQQVSEAFLGDEGGDAVWINYRTTPGSVSFLENPVYTVRRDRAQGSQPSGALQRLRGWVSRPPITAPPAGDPGSAPGVPGVASLTFEDPSWHYLETITELESLVGDTVECYPHEAYTRSTIELYQRTRQPVPVVKDPYNALGHFKALQVLDTVGADAPHGDTAVTAARWCVQLLKELLAAYAEEAERAAQYPPRPPKGLEAATWAAFLVPPTAEGRKDLIQRHDEALPENDLPVLLHRVRHWRDNVDEFSDAPNPTLFDALDIIEGSLSGRVHYLDPDFAASDGPESQPRGPFQVYGPHTRAYLDSVHWVPDRTPDRRQRRLERLVSYRSSTDIRYGLDPAGRLVVTGTDEYAQDRSHPQFFAVEWPCKPPATGLSATAHIVGDLATSGDQPAYILDDGSIDLLPQSQHNAHSGWNWGYGGGSPGALASAIFDCVAAADGLPDAGDWSKHDQARRWISDQIDHADERNLDVSVREIRKRW